MKDFVGMVCARKDSKRLAQKNLLLINGKMLVNRAVETLRMAQVERTYVLTDIDRGYIKAEYVTNRPAHLNTDDVSLTRVVMWGIDHLELWRDYRNVVLLMPNAPLISPEQIMRAMVSHRSNKRSVTRSYNADTGEENGLYILSIDYLASHGFPYDVYTGGLICNGIEIHNDHDYVLCKHTLETPGVDWLK